MGARSGRPEVFSQHLESNWVKRECFLLILSNQKASSRAGTEPFAVSFDGCRQKCVMDGSQALPASLTRHTLRGGVFSFPMGGGEDVTSHSRDPVRRKAVALLQERP